MSSFTNEPVLKFHDINHWEVIEPFEFYRKPIVDKNGIKKNPDEYTEEDKKDRSIEVVTIPQGFITDLATVPRIFWSLFPPHDLYCKAAIVHDYLYENAIGTKREADLIFKEALEVLGLPKWKVWLFYWGARLVGRGNY